MAAGADAIYLSGKRFGARKFAANFSEDELKEAIDYAHLRGVKVYVTVNTLAREDELLDVARYLVRLYEIGADAILVQDAGVAALARTLVSGLDLHASTQMTIHNLEGGAWAERLGMKRVVLSREVSLVEAEEMARSLNVGLEVFIHGALCYCYSGQCLMSSAIGGRSGNRGMCAQPCRKPYVLLRCEKDEYGRPINLSAAPIKDKFLISTRDLSVYDQLERTATSGIESLKIEGRMKSPEYVAVVVSIYRRSLDAIAKGSWTPSEEDMRNLSLAFNRDFTGGYLLESGQVMGREMSDNRGVLAGAVASYDAARGEAAVRLSSSLTPEQGDGLVFIAPGQEMGMVVRKPPYQKDGLLRLRTPDRVKPGARMYVTSSTALSRQAEKISTSSRAQVPLDLKVSFKERTPIVEAIIHGPKDDLKVEVKADFSMKVAKTKPLSSDQIEAQLRRAGGTPFVVRKLEMDYPGGLFAPIAALNHLRREVLVKAEEALLNSRRPEAGEIKAALERLKDLDLESTAVPERRVPALSAYVDSIEAIRGSCEGGCIRIYFEPRLGHDSRSEKAILRVLKDARDACGSAQLVWKWPRITRGSYLNFAAPLVSKAEVDGIMVEGIGAAEAVIKANPDVKLYGSSSLNVWNHLSVKQLSPPFFFLTLSPELSADQLSDLVGKYRQSNLSSSRVQSQTSSQTPAFELLVQGNLEVMVTEDCLPCLVKDKAEFLGLQDFRRIFPLMADDDRRTHFFNSVETCLIDYMPRLFQIGLDGIAIDARGRTGKYAREMAELYSSAIKLTEKEGKSPTLKDGLEALKNEARIRSLGGITSGHFIKGLRDEVPVKTEHHRS